MRTLLAIAAMLIVPAIASAQLRFTQPTADLGELRGGLVYQQRFEFVNDGVEPIEIIDIRLGCGCLSPVYDQRVYQKGEKGSLLMHIRTLGQPNGPRTWQAHVDYRHAGKSHETTILIAAKIRNEVTIEPSIIAMQVETTLKQELTITDHRETKLKVSNVLATSPAIKITTQPIKDGITRIILEVSGAALTAARQEEMLNLYTDDPNYRHLQVPITLTKAVRSAITASPAKIELIGTDSQLVRLRSADDKPVRIEKIESDHPAIRCTWAPGPGNDATLKIAIDAQKLQTQDSSTNVRVYLGVTIVTIPVILRRD